MSGGFHPGVWLAWAAAALTVASVAGNPVGLVAALIGIWVVAVSFRQRGPEGDAFGLMLRIGLIVIIARVVLFGLTGHTGRTTVAVLPELRLPAWLGGFTIGGRVTAEVLVHEVAEGLRIAVLLAAFGAFLAIVETYRVLRLLPRALLEAGLIIGIALAFVPTLLRSAADVRDAQRLRGHRFRGFRALRALVTPVLAGALERSLDLAASLESRGYGRHGAVVPARARLALLASLLAFAGGGAAVLMGGPAWTLLPALAGGAGLVWGIASIGRAGARTRLPERPLDAWDRAALLGAFAVAVAAVALRDATLWYAYPVAGWPALDPRVLAVGAALALPTIIDAVRDSMLRRASRRNEPRPLERVEAA